MPQIFHPGANIIAKAYIRESITNPAANIPLTDEDVQNLAVLIHSLTK
jgi:hypothetical protein